MARHTGEREIASTAYVRTALAARGMPVPGTGSHSHGRLSRSTTHGAHFGADPSRRVLDMMPPRGQPTCCTSACSQQRKRLRSCRMTASDLQ